MLDNFVMITFFLVVYRLVEPVLLLVAKLSFKRHRLIEIFWCGLGPPWTVLLKVSFIECGGWRTVNEVHIHGFKLKRLNCQLIFVIFRSLTLYVLVNLVCKAVEKGCLGQLHTARGVGARGC